MSKDQSNHGDIMFTIVIILTRFLSLFQTEYYTNFVKFAYCYKHTTPEMLRRVIYFGFCYVTACEGN